jgi:aryl-alcohol dehydrogenase-like predicted oxidoreductase
MDYSGLGSTGMQVSPLCLGAMMFGAWGESDHEKCVQIIHRALDAGINFIDTADVYSLGESEQIVGKALAGGRREDVILATKFHAPMDVGFGGSGGNPNKRGNSRRWIVKEVEDSLTRLQTDWIDLYQVHRPEPGTDVEETLSALTDLRAQGKIRAFGCSTFPAHELVAAHWTSQRRGLGRFATEQPPYSILVRAIEADVLPVVQRHGMGVIPWSPLAGGWLTGLWRKGQQPPQSRRAQRLPARFDLSLPGNQAKLEAVEQLAQLAEQAGLSLIHMALAFTLSHPAVTAPIIGPRTMEQLESQLGAEQVTLSKDVLDRIDEIVAPGTTLSVGDRGYVPPALSDPALRRLPSGLA